MMPRIAYMTGEYPRATDTFIQREVAALRQADVHVETFSIRKPAMAENVGPEQEAERRRTRYILPACPWELLKTHFQLITRKPHRYLAALRTAVLIRPGGIKSLGLHLAYFAEAGLVARHLSEEQLTHLHNHFSNSSCTVAMLAAELGGFTFSFTMHGPAEFFEPKFWRIDEKIRRALFVSCISHFCRSQAMIFAPRKKWDRMHINHCGVDPRQFSRRRHAGEGRRLLFIGRLAGVKGVPFLLESIALLKRDFPNISLDIAGDGPDRAALEHQAQDLGIAAQVRFLGYQSQSQIRELMGETDVFVMASFAEGVPVVLMEAMAACVPVVATQVAGVPELVEPGVSGFLVPPGDAKSLAQKTAMLLADADLRQRFGDAGRKKVDAEFNIELESNRLVRVLIDALAGRMGAIRPEVDEEYLAVEASPNAGVGSPSAAVRKPDEQCAKSETAAR